MERTTNKSVDHVRTTRRYNDVWFNVLVKGNSSVFVCVWVCVCVCARTSVCVWGNLIVCRTLMRTELWEQRVLLLNTEDPGRGGVQISDIFALWVFCRLCQQHIWPTFAVQWPFACTFTKNSQQKTCYTFNLMCLYYQQAAKPLGTRCFVVEQACACKWKCVWT